MKLYGSAVTISSKRLEIFLSEIGVSGIERIEINVREGANLTAEYQEKSVNGKVPLLELDDGVCIAETIAICRYFNDITPNELNLFGSTPLEQAQIEMWNRIVEIDGIQNAFQAFRNTSGLYSDRENCVKEWGVEAKHRVELFLPKLDMQLGKSDYVATMHYSIADISAYILVFVASKALGIGVLDSYSNIRRWYEVVTDRAAIQSN
ncbi:glutathione S-transferase N-terminal domain-containing protein [Vibrio sp. 10N.261.51.F12]|uniref:glutathione S-transferase N-terminal domain-containing protein n=1 Tax=Vibrio sp. 10N.261.51.F12 TaxID=3229679 RepID=UPI00354E2E8D